MNVMVYCRRYWPLFVGHVGVYLYGHHNIIIILTQYNLLKPPVPDSSPEKGTMR